MDQAASSRDFLRAENVGHRFALAVDMLPSLIGVYQALGRPQLQDHGYDLEIEDPRLREEALRQTQHLRVSQAGAARDSR